MTRPIYPRISNIHPLIMAMLNPTNLLLKACPINKTVDSEKSARKKLLAASEGLYAQKESSSGQVARVQ
jgi:hypothetical protein